MVGDVTLSFVPVLACLIVLGLWPAMAVAAVSGLTAAWVTRDPVKIAFNVANYVVSTYLAGLLYLALTPAGGAFMTQGPADVRRDRSSTSSCTPCSSPA